MILLAGMVGGFSLVTDLPWLLALGVGLAGVLGASALRLRGGSDAAEFAAVPALLSLGVLATAAPATPLAALLGGGSALALLVWLADDPARIPGGPRRSGSTLMVVTLAFGIAWGSALLLPPTSGALGIAGGLLAVSLFLIATLLRRPQLLESPPAATA